MFEREISLILLCISVTIYGVLLIRVGRVVVHLCDHNYYDKISTKIARSLTLNLSPRVFLDRPCPGGGIQCRFGVLKLA
jgi:hypothetical protein